MAADSERLFTVSVSAPGKVILHGEHSVVYGKTAIAASLGLKTCIVIKEVHQDDEPTIKIHLPSVGIEQEINVNPISSQLFRVPLKEKATGKFSWHLPEMVDHEPFLASIEKFLTEHERGFTELQPNQKNALRSFVYMYSGIIGSSGVSIKSLEITMGSELTVGAGTGSSASFAVCLAAALIRLIQMKTSKTDAFYEAENFNEFTTKEKEIISRWAFNCERIMHGTPSGIDNEVCTFGSVVQFRRGERLKPLVDLSKVTLRILLVNTRVSRETRTQVARVANLRQWNRSMVDHVMDAIDALTKKSVEILTELAEGKDGTNEDVNFKRLSELWNMNHCLLSTLGVSHPQLDIVHEAAARHGLASKLTGAGGGGYAIVLVPPTTPRSAVDKLTSELMERGFAVKETKLGGEGVQVEM